MKLHLEFINIIDQPRCKISINHEELYSGPVLEVYDFDVPHTQGAVSIVITHWDKQPYDTVVKNGQIVRDRSFELARLIVDGYDLEELIWHSEFRAVDGAVYPSCLFFGPNGDFVLDFTMPVLAWILHTRHTKNNNDPHWEEDYNYYITACQLLQQISIK